MPFGNSSGPLSRRDTTTIAQRFNAGTGPFCVAPVPKGRLNPSSAGRVPFRPALGRPFGTWGHLTAKPSVETLGHSAGCPSGTGIGSRCAFEFLRQIIATLEGLSQRRKRPLTECEDEASPCRPCAGGVPRGGLKTAADFFDVAIRMCEGNSAA